MNDANELVQNASDPNVTFGKLQRSMQNLSLAKQETLFGNISGLVTKLTGQPNATVPEAQRQDILRTAQDIAANAKQLATDSFDNVDKAYPKYSSDPGWQALKNKFHPAQTPAMHGKYEMKVH